MKPSNKPLKDIYVVAMRVPASTYNELTAEAIKNDRPISLQALHILKKHFSTSAGE